MRTFVINEGKFEGIIDILEEKEDGNVEVDVPYFKTSIRFSIDGKMSDIYKENCLQVYNKQSLS